MKIFIVDDDRSIRQTLRDVLEDEDFEVEDFATGRAMVKALGRERPALILLDVWMGKEDGLDILDRIKEVYPTLPVLMISGHGTIEQAVQATKKGAVDFLEKPLSLDTVLERISQALKLEDRKNGKVPEPIRLEFDEIIGNSEQILQVKRSISQAAQTNARVFIYGENGTGKELVARAIYQNSKRRDQPFIEVNCAAIPEELIESELFGHEKGAFTGAETGRPGKFELANGGTLFLDEIGEMP
ncbi:MAG: sigma-54-dependent Fis family transcriptional regulator, partial [Leptospiraceae bacterium]|nr:sigma-54-dependent Fis family transcriptional regulator [Leptospiraceae bacterium]